MTPDCILNAWDTHEQELRAFLLAPVYGSLLAVCSCAVLPLFRDTYKRGAGFGEAIAFLYSRPTINTMAVVVTAKMLGAEIGIVRAVGVILFALVIGTINCRLDDHLGIA